MDRVSRVETRAIKCSEIHYTHVILLGVPVLHTTDYCCFVAANEKREVSV